MSINVKNLSDLTDQDIEGWRSLQQNDAALVSPFYCPDFAKAIHDAGKSVQVALISDSDRLVGLLPFHKGRLGTGIPVGGQISDYQGLIGQLKPDTNIANFLKLSGLTSYDFNHLPVDQTAFARGHFDTSNSPYLDLAEGFEAYFAQRRSKKNKVLKNAVRNLRILERDIGTVHVEIDDQTDAAWQTLVTWKNRSFQQMGVKSILETPWARQAFQSIRKTKNPHFAGLLSSLYVNDKLAAVHFGMRSQSALHWWFPTYDQKLSKYSPGIVLLMEVAKRCPDIGITWLDLGRGSQPYKNAFANGSTTLCEGSIERRASIAGSARVLRKTVDRTFSRMSRLTKPAKFQRRAFNRLLGAVYLPD